MSKSQLQRSPRMTAYADDTACHILHVDMDAFYVGVELLDRPDLHGTPVIVGGNGNRGVVLSASYEARAQGVYSGMPTSRARRLSPTAEFLSPRHHRYAEVSSSIMEIFRATTQWVEPLSLDEAFLDVRGLLRTYPNATTIGELIRARIADEQGLTASVGIAANKFIAKLASTRAKPDGLLVVPPANVIEFLHPMPVSALWGVGEKTEEKLGRLGLRTIGDIASTPVPVLQRIFGVKTGQHLADLAWGRDDRAVSSDRRDRSVGADETFPVDVDDNATITAELLRLSEHVAARLRASDHVGRTVTVKVRFADFTTLTRSRTLDTPVDVGQDIYQVARSLYESLHLQRARIRLIGVRVENLRSAQHAARQLAIGEPDRGWRDVAETMDRAAQKFGRDTLRPARLLTQRVWEDPRGTSQGDHENR